MFISEEMNDPIVSDNGVCLLVRLARFLDCRFSI
jgi:hypothetical protein